MWKILGKKKPSKVPEQLVFPGKSRYEKDPIKKTANKQSDSGGVGFRTRKN